jgi:hypothetical protein
MGLRKVARVAKAVHDVATSDNPGKAAAKVVSTALQVTHPIPGTILKKPVEKATEALVNKGIEIAKDPKVRAKVRKTATNVGNKAVEIGGNAARATRRGARSAVRKAQAFREGHSR